MLIQYEHRLVCNKCRDNKKCIRILKHGKIILRPTCEDCMFDRLVDVMNDEVDN